jgi:transforming growth factor-beta-induced protein
MTRSISSALVAAALVLSTSAAVAEDKKDLIDTAAEGGQFKTLVAAFKEAGMTETLKGKGPITLFAPTDEAFQKVPAEKLKTLLADREKLKKVLMAHVVAGKDLRGADVAKLNGQTVNGFVVKADADKVMIGKATITKSDITCSNGVLHVIDAVLLPD